MNTSESTLFVIDDDSKSRKAVAALASSLKIRCETFASAEDFLVRYNPSLVGCALIDYRLPGMDGLELQERLRILGSPLAAVVVSAYADVPMAVRAMKNGAVAVVEKPYRSDALIDVVRKALDRSAHAQQACNDKDHIDDYWQRLFAHDLHDGAAQYLVMAIMLLEDCRHRCDLYGEKERATFQDALRLLRRSLGELRCLIRGLRVATTAVSLGDALEQTLSDFRDRLDIELVCDPQLVDLEAPLTGAVCRMAQELLSNAWRHSRSRRVRIEVARNEGNLCMDVRDWGIGFDVDRVERDCFGLQGVRERARLFGGEATISSAVGEGTYVLIRMPIVSPSRGEGAAACFECESPS
jgi:signal transduction histidine kinase